MLNRSAALERKQRQDEAYLDSKLDELSVESRYILGNDDWFESTRRKHYLRNKATIGDTSFVPFEWVSSTPFNTNREINENMMRYKLEKMSEMPLDWQNTVVVAHMPPLGVGDTLYNGSRCGSMAIRNWIEEVQPKLWLCEHIYEDFGMGAIGNTLVFNCACRHDRNIFCGWLIDTETLKFEKIKEHV